MKVDATRTVMTTPVADLSIGDVFTFVEQGLQGDAYMGINSAGLQETYGRVCTVRLQDGHVHLLVPSVQVRHHSDAVLRLQTQD